MNRVLIGTGALIAGVVAAVGVMAAPGDGPGAKPTPLPMPAGMMGHAALCVDPAAEIAGGVAYAEKRLGVTDAQRPAWTKLVAALNAAEPKIKAACETAKTHGDAMRAHREANERPSLVETLDFATAMSKAGAEVLGLIQPPAVEFYNTLTPDQKKIADTLVHRAPPHMMGDHHGPRFDRSHDRPADGAPGDTPKR